MGQRAFAPPLSGRLVPAMEQDANSNEKKIIDLFLPYIASFCGCIVTLS